jgi:hypothetical protein
MTSQVNTIFSIKYRNIVLLLQLWQYGYYRGKLFEYQFYSDNIRTYKVNKSPIEDHLSCAIQQHITPKTESRVLFI